MGDLFLFADPDIQERKATLRKTVHKFYNDPGHGWLEVNKADLKILNIEKEISGYSYMQGNKAYLEEDCDMATYIYALFPDLKEHPNCNPPMEFTLFQNNCIKDEYREHIFIRGLLHYSF